LISDEQLLGAIRRVVREEITRANGHFKNAKYLCAKEVAALLGVPSKRDPSLVQGGQNPKTLHKAMASTPLAVG
jgi:hypothetical protein